MKLSVFLVIKAVISLVFGICFAVVPVAVMSLFGPTLDPAGVNMARLLGACLIGIGLVCWLDRFADHGALMSIVLALFVADTIGFVVSVLAMSSGIMNALGWVNAVLWLLLALGLGYFRFFKKYAP
jgi:hypothetical protein